MTNADATLPEHLASPTIDSRRRSGGDALNDGKRIKLKSCRRRSLKTRVTLFTLVIFLISIWSLAFYVSLRLRDDMQRLLGRQQLATVTFRADEVNRALGDRLAALGRIAGMLDRQTLADRSALAEFIAGRPVLNDLFNAGVGVVDHAAQPLLPARRNGNDSVRVSVAAALDEGRSTIGPPRVDADMQAPVFAMSVPIRDERGDVVAALYGVTQLDRANFLDRIMESYYGERGYYLLADPHERVIVTNTGKQRILDLLPASGENALIDRFVAGSDESGVTRDTNVGEILASARRIYFNDWFIIAAQPTDEAFALIATMRRYMVQAAVLLTLLAGGLTWWMIRRELSPMLATIRTLGALARTGEAPQALPVAGHDEIGQLIDGFNHLLESLGQREVSLQNTLRFQQTMMDAVPSPVFYKDNNGAYLGSNAAFERFIGLPRAQFIGKTVFDIAPLDLALISDQADRALLAAPGVHSYESLVAHADGSRHDVVFNNATFTDSAGQVAGLIGVILDITERKLAENRIRTLAFYDQLTGLPNRRLLDDRLQQTIAASRRNGRRCALMFLDLDNFKPLNDRHGHAAGDLLLAEAAQRLHGCVRENDTVARFGGDEFVIAVGDLSADRGEAMEQTAAIAEKARGALAAPYRLTVRHEGLAPDSIEHECTVSIGVALLDDLQTSIDDFLTHADSALYQAKAGGRNQVRFFVSSDSDHQQATNDESA